LSEAKDLKWPKNEILRYTQNDKKREKCFFTQSDVPFVTLKNIYIIIMIDVPSNPPPECDK
ncbi:MAG: hypothetical protein ACOCG5_07580, partial [Candidatus Alkaliphilus sp. MAG34]